MATREFKVIISQDQAALAEDIKKVHQWLRRRTQEVGADRAWEEHLQRSDILKNYAKSMKELAVNYWDQNNKGNRESLSRINWVIKEITAYFKGGGYQAQSDKESSRFGTPPFPILEVTERFTLLDVGSCYNPFKICDWIQTFPIDLCPATDDVKTCNFLDTLVCNDPNWWNKSPIKILPSSWFHIVTFSLFLEYLPSPEHRLTACKTAYNVLKPGGLLLIVTPDSKHSSANARLMKNWKLALVKIGFVRITLEKLPYLYCMTFRKTLFPSKHVECLIEDGKGAILSIPQDTVDYLTQKFAVPFVKINAENVRDDFLELPSGDIFSD